MSCFNRNTLILIAVVAAATFAVAPSAISAVGPLIIALACPIGMLVMMGGATRAAGRRCGDERPTETADPSVSDPEAAEIARLRREVADLRAEMAARSGPLSTGDGGAHHPAPDGRP